MQDAENVNSDSVFAWCPRTLQGTDAGIVSNGDEYISYAFDTWASYLADGYTEFIELGFDTPVYAQSVEVGENRGMGSIVHAKAFDNVTNRWATLYTGDADIEVYEYCGLTNQYHVFAPSICETTFATSRLRLEMDTYAIVDWNEIDYVKLIGATVGPKTGVIHADAAQSGQVVYVADSNYVGEDFFTFVGCDCAYYSSRTSSERKIPLLVGAVNDAPITSDLQANLVCDDGIEIVLTAIELDGDNVTYRIESLPSAAVLSDGETGEVITPDEVPADISGSDVALSLAITDAGLQEDSLDFMFSASDQIGVRSTISSVRVSCSALSCDAGSFYDAAVGSCTACPAGTAEGLSGMRSRCSACPKGYYSLAGLPSCIRCVDGYGERYFTAQSGSVSCKICPAGATCPSGKEVVVDPEFWRTGVASLNMLSCPMGVGCIGGNSTSSELCAEGYSGVLCAVCADGFFPSEQKCRRCGENERTLVIGSAVVVMALSALIVVLVFGGTVIFHISKHRCSRFHRKVLVTVWDVAKFKVLP